MNYALTAYLTRVLSYRSIVVFKLLRSSGISSLPARRPARPFDTRLHSYSQPSRRLSSLNIKIQFLELRRLGFAEKINQRAL